MDLEEDLFEVIPEVLKTEFGDLNPVSKLQDKKMLNMIKLTKVLTTENCKEVYSHSNFECLRRLVED